MWIKLVVYMYICMQIFEGAQGYSKSISQFVMLVIFLISSGWVRGKSNVVTKRVIIANCNTTN